jgi:hypothetical protein
VVEWCGRVALVVVLQDVACDLLHLVAEGVAVAVVDAGFIGCEVSWLELRDGKDINLKSFVPSPGPRD